MKKVWYVVHECMYECMYLGMHTLIVATFLKNAYVP